MIYTSYFAKLQHLQRYMNNNSVSLTVMSIAGGSPKWFEGLRAVSIPDLHPMVPTKELVMGYKAGKISENEYVKQYNQQLTDNTSAILIAADCLDGFVLLCYEKPSSFCHRQLLAAFLSEHGFETRELEL